MSDNVALVMRSFEAMRAWDVDALLQLYHPDVAFLPLTGTPLGERRLPQPRRRARLHVGGP